MRQFEGRDLEGKTPMVGLSVCRAALERRVQWHWSRVLQSGGWNQ